MTKVYTNVVALALISATVASILFKILETAGAASIIVPLGIGLTVGFLQIALVMARRQKVFKGPFAPVSINAISLFAAAWIVLPVAFGMGATAFREAIINAIDPPEHCQHHALGSARSYRGGCSRRNHGFCQSGRGRRR